MARKWFVPVGTTGYAKGADRHPATIRRQAAAGKIPGAHKEAGRWVIPAPTKIAARALGVSESTVRRRAGAGAIPTARLDYRPEPVRIAEGPPAGLVARAEAGEFPDPLRNADAAAWLDRAPGWIAEGIDAGMMPVDAGVILHGHGIPELSEGDYLKVFHEPGGPWVVVIETADGASYTVPMPRDAAWGLYGWAGEAGLDTDKDVTTP